MSRMKTLKRIVSLFLAASIMMSLVVVGYAVDNGAIVSFAEAKNGNYSVKAGEPATFTATIANNPGFISFTFFYDVKDASGTSVKESFKRHIVQDKFGVESWAVTAINNFAEFPSSSFTLDENIVWNSTASVDFKFNEDLFTMKLVPDTDLLNGKYKITFGISDDKNFANVSQQAVPVTFQELEFTLTGGVDPTTLVPTISTQPQDVKWTYGDSAAKTLTVEATKPENNSGELAFQWYKGTDASDKTPDDSKKVENGTTASLSLSAPTSWNYDQTDYYFCVVTNTYNEKTYSATSDVAAVTYEQATITEVTLDKTTTVYNGQPQTVNATVKSSDATLGTSDYDVSAESQLTGTAVGTYNVSVTGKGNYKGTANASWSITAAEITSDATKSVTVYNNGKEYSIAPDVTTVGNQTASIAYTLTPTDLVTLNATEGTVIGNSNKKTGTATVTANITAPNHTAKTVTITITVSNKTDLPEGALTFNYANSSAPDWTYDASTTHRLNEAVSAANVSDTNTYPGGTITYDLKKDGTTVASNLTDLTKTVQDAGSYTVVAYFENDTHQGSKELTFEIKKAQVDLETGATWTSNPTYNGAEQTVTVTLGSGVASLVAENPTYAGNTGTDAGQYTATATFTLKDADNYEFKDGENQLTKAWEITKAASLTADAIEQSVRYSDGATKTISAADIKKDGNAIAGLTISGVTPGTDTNNILKTDSLTVTGGVAEYAINTADVFDSEKTATFTITGTSKNYTTVTATVTVKRIDKIPVDSQVTFNPEALTATYNGTPRAVSENAASFGGTKDGNGTITYKYNTGTDGAWSDTAPTNAGTYKVQATYEDNSQRGKKEATYTINKAELTITGATVTAKDYDATDTATITAVDFEGLVDGENLTLTTDYTVSDAKFTNKNAGTNIDVTFTVTLVTDMDNTAKNYTLKSETGTAKGTINKKNVTSSAALTLTPATSAFNNAVQTPTVKVTYETDKEMAASEYTVTYADGRKDVGTYAVTVAPKDSSNYTFTELSKDFVITQAAKDDITIAKVHKAGDSVTIDLPTLENPGTPGATYTVGEAVADILTETATTNGNKLSYTIKSDAAADATGSIEVTVTSGNYATYKITVAISVTTKDIPNATVENLVKTYDGKALTADSFQKSSGGVDGNWTIKTNASSTDASNVPYDVVLTFTPADTEAYVAVDVPAQVTINKAQPVIQPTFTPITEAGKTLADAHLKAFPDTMAGTLGTIAWDDGDATVVVANQSYGWTFTPDDATNYETATGTLIPFVQNPPDETEEPNVPPILPPSGGNGSGSTGGGSGSGSGNQGGSTTNPDQSVTTTTTDRDGNVTTTTTYPDGSKSVVEMKTDGTIISTDTDAQGNTATVTQNPDGSSVKTVENIDGSSSIQNTTSDGQTSAMVNLPSETVDASNASGAPASLPMDAVTATKDSATAPVVMVNTANDEPVKVEIPVTNANNGTVAVLVKADGTEEIIKTTALTGDGVAVKVNSGDTVKIIDNTKTFSDTATHWGSDAVTFVAARELFSGTSETRFSPDDNMTRGMLMTVLARYENVDTNGGSVWYEKGVAWAVAQGLSDGTNPNGQISREQLATIIYRYAQSKGIDTTAGGSLERFPDAGSVSDWAREAMSWAVGNGIISGVGGVTLDPSGNATRAQVATILMRFSEKFPA